MTAPARDPSAPSAATSPATPLLQVRDLAITHEGEDVAIPASVTFDVARGEVVLILGPSGSGKSTLTLALNGLLPQAVPATVTGAVLVGELDASVTPVSVLSTHVGMVFQDPDAQLVTGTLLDEVAFGPENLRLPVADVLDRAERALRRVGLWERRHDNPDLLSGGGRQRLAIACALAMGSPLLVLDEPTANLDPQGIEEVYAALADLVAAGDRAIVLVEHNLDAAVGFVDRVVVMDASGTVVADGSVDAVLRRRADELHDMGVWLPISALAALRLRRAGFALDPLPLTPAELHAALEAEPRPPVPALPVLEPRPPAPEPPTPVPGPVEGPVPEPHPPVPEPVEGPTPTTTLRQAQGPNPPTPGTTLRQAQGPKPPTPTTTLRQAQGPNPPTPGIPLVTVRDLHLRRGKTAVLRGISLDIHAGEFVAVVGANGAGKTTLLQAIAGVVPPPRGTVHMGDLDISRADARTLASRIGFVFQNPEHQFIAHTVFDEVAHGLRLQHLPDAEVRARSNALLARFGLTDKAHTHPFLLSGGQKRRLSVGTALVAGAPMLALDEPTFGQDRAHADELLSLLQQLNREGTTIIVVTHDMQLVTEYADRTLVLADGRVRADGPTSAVFTDAPLIERSGLRLPPLAQALQHVTRHPELAVVTRLSDLPGARA